MCFSPHLTAYGAVDCRALNALINMELQVAAGWNQLIRSIDFSIRKEGITISKKTAPNVIHSEPSFLGEHQFPGVYPRQAAG
jgi:hypothetical protein